MRSLIYTHSPWQKTYSEIIDVRSEEEFAADHIPGAINLPVLDSQERIKVGTIYKQVSPFEARKMGAALIGTNISQHLINHFASKDKTYSPLIYCWRGGQRSGSLAMVLTQIGWQVTVLEGGYKTYRALIRQGLATLPQQFTFKILCGLTGSGKTDILKQLADKGEQVLDLEALANHRGSLLGQIWSDLPQPQPSQKWFESLLLQKLQHFNPTQSVWLESESNKIGAIYLPLAFWETIRQAHCIEVQLPIAQRVKRLLQEYAHLGHHREILKENLQQLKSRYGKDKIQYWCTLVESGAGSELIADLLENHYDPAYYRSISHLYQSPQQVISLLDLSNKSLEWLLDQLTVNS